MNIWDLPRTRREAIKLNSKYYYTGKPCKRGHTSMRYTLNHHCVLCDRRRSARSGATSRMIKQHRAYYEADLLEKKLPKKAGNTLYARPVERTKGPRGC